MGRFYQHYASYRRIGFARADALHFAWLVTVSGVSPVPIRIDPFR